MKKRLSLILLCGVMALCGTSCSSDKTTESSSTVNYQGEAQKADSAEEALKEFFRLNYTRDSGEAAFNYMYIQPIIDNMIEKDEYRQRVLEYNNGKNEYLDLVSTVPYIKSINEMTPFNEEQLGWASQYFIDYAASMGVTVDSVSVAEGYSFQCTVVDQNGNEKPDTECLVKIEEEGWKYITSLTDLESMYGSGEANTTAAATTVSE